MAVAIRRPLPPMEALSAAEIPVGGPRQAAWSV
jgi:hypothetical protein